MFFSSFCLGIQCFFCHVGRLHANEEGLSIKCGLVQSRCLTFVGPMIFDWIGVLHCLPILFVLFFSDGSEMKSWSYTGYCLTASWTRDPMAQEMTWHKTPEMNIGT